MAGTGLREGKGAYGEGILGVLRSVIAGKNASSVWVAVVWDFFVSELGPGGDLLVGLPGAAGCSAAPHQTPEGAAPFSPSGGDQNVFRSCQLHPGEQMTPGENCCPLLCLIPGYVKSVFASVHT